MKEEIIFKAVSPSVDWLMSNGGEDLIDLGEAISLLNYAREDFGRVAQTIIRHILTFKTAYAIVSADLDELSRQHSSRLAELENLYMRKDEQNPNYKINTTQKYAKNCAEQDELVTTLSAKMEKLSGCKQKIWGIKEILEDLLEAAKVIAANPETTRPSGKVMDRDEIDEMVNDFKQKLN